MFPKISVIVPVLNRENLILRCLDSVLGQTVKPFEIIVVDNGSSDSTVSSVKSWISKNEQLGISMRLLSQPIRGACHARRLGMEQARGEYLSFFDSDDVMRENLIEETSQVIEKNRQADIVCWPCRIHNLDGSSKIPPFMPHNPIEGHLIHSLLRPQGYVVRKEFIEKAGGWSKPITVWNDLELGMRLLLNNPEIKSINKLLAEIYSQEVSITGKDFSSKEGEWEKTLHEMEEVISNSEHPQKKKIAGILNYRKIVLAAQYFKEGNFKYANNLLEEALKETGSIKKTLGKLVFRYASLGLRGSWRIVRFAY